MIIVAGEALVDLVVHADGAVEAAPGGAPYNTARAAARLGADVGFVGALSRDRFGTLLTDGLAADGVDTAMVRRTDRPTTLAVAELDPAGAATYRFYIDGTSAPALGPDDLVPTDPPDIVFAGGLGLVLQPMASTIASMLDGGGAVTVGPDTLVMIDLNCRPSVVPDRDAYLDLLGRVLARADIVKVSDEDLRYVRPQLEPVDAAVSLLDLGPSAVLVTEGSRHTSVVTADGTVTVPVAPAPAPIVDTIGAGDTFGGALIAWWAIAGRTRADVIAERLIPAVEAAHAAAGLVVTRRGADPPRRHDLPADWVPSG